MNIGGLVIRRQRKTRSFDLKTFHYPLKSAVWICLFATSIMVAITKLIMSNRKVNVFGLLWTSFATNFGGHFDTNETYRNSYKVLLFTTLFCGNIIWMGYQASLTVDLSVPINKLPFDSLETFLQTDWNIYTASKR